MSESSGTGGVNGTLSEVRAVAVELLARAAGPEITDSGLFPYGVNRVAVSIRAGEVEVTMEIAGPDHGHFDQEWEEEEDEVFEDDEE